jgi:glycosyltransferase involved in cell wall biosynthesis
MGEMNPPTEQPLVTIGMPVRNEAPFIAEAIESLLAQTYPRIRIVIADNASTDDTSEIAMKYAAADDRIAYERRPSNVGMIENFNAVARAAEGKYFMWAAGHDLWSSDYVEKLVAMLESDRRAVLAFGDLKWVAEDGSPGEGRPARTIDTGDISNPVARFNLTFWTDQHPIYGLHRLKVLHRSKLAPPSVVPGAVLLSELAILGRFRYVPGVQSFRRLNREREGRAARRDRYASELFASPRRQRFAHWRIPLDFLRVAAKTPLRGRARRQRRVLLMLSATNAAIRYWGELRADLQSKPEEQGTR